MSETPSTMIPLGTKAPDFKLIDTVSGKEVSLGSEKSYVATVIMFICNHCPYVKHIQRKLVAVARHFQSKNIRFIAISSNDATSYPDDGPKQMKEEAMKHEYPFPYLYDETQLVAKAYRAACTPDFFVYDKDLVCVYRGRFDESTPGNGKEVTGKDLSNTLNCLINNEPLTDEQLPSLGCNIKWFK